jgi:sugar lactone lactonase YvrE
MSIVQSLLAVIKTIVTWKTDNSFHDMFEDTPQNWFRVTPESEPNGVFFKPDGTKMYVVGRTQDDVTEYDLSVAWDIKSATYNQEFSVSSQETQPTGIFFRNDGTSEAGKQMYVCGKTGNDINEYTLTTAWDVSTASYSRNFSFATQDTTVEGIFFKSDGTELYVSGDANNKIYQYSLETAWNVSTASFDQDLGVSAQDGQPEGVFFRDDGSANAGKQMYVVGNSSNAIDYYTLTTAWDLSTASFSHTEIIGSIDNSPQGVFFKSDGSKMYLVGSKRDAIFQFDLSTDWDVSTASFDFPDNDHVSIKTEDTNPFGLFFKDDGSKMYVSGKVNDSVYEYDLSPAWNVASATYLRSYGFSTQEGSCNDIAFKGDGSKMYLLGNDGDDINQYSLSADWNVTTASFDSAFSFNTTVGGALAETNPTGIFFRDDGTADAGKKMYVVGTSQGAVQEYDLQTAWDVSTASFNGSFVDSGTGRFAYAAGLFFKPDGKRFWVFNRATTNLLSYELSIAWDITSASYDYTSAARFFSESPRDVFFKPDGTKFWVLDNSVDQIWGFNVI